MTHEQSEFVSETLQNNGNITENDKSSVVVVDCEEVCSTTTEDCTKGREVPVKRKSRTSSRSSISTKNKSRNMVDTRHQKENRDNMDRRSSSENQGNNSFQSVKEEVLSDDQNSSVSDRNLRTLITRSKIRRLERRKAYSSHSSALESDNRKTKSEPIELITLSDSEDNISILSSRPNRSARIRGELIRKLSGTPTKINKYKHRDSSSSSEYENERRKKKSKSKPLKASSTKTSKRKKYLVNKLSCQRRHNLRKHQKPHISYIPHVYKSKKKSRDRTRIRKRYEYQKKESKVSIVSVKKSSQQRSVCIEKRSLRSTSTDTAVDNAIKTEIINEVKKCNTGIPKSNPEVKNSDLESSKELPVSETLKESPDSDLMKDMSDSEPLKKIPDTEILKKHPDNNILKKVPESDSLKKNSDADSMKNLPDKDSLKKFPDKDSLKKFPDKDSVKKYPDKDSVKKYPDKDSVKKYPDKDSVNVKKYPDKDSVKKYPDKDSVKKHSDKDSVKKHSDKDSVKKYSDKDSVKKYSDKDTMKKYPDKDTMKKYFDKDTMKKYSDKDTVKKHPDKDTVKKHSDKDILKKLPDRDTFKKLPDTEMEKLPDTETLKKLSIAEDNKEQDKKENSEHFETKEKVECEKSLADNITEELKEINTKLEIKTVVDDTTSKKENREIIRKKCSINKHVERVKKVKKIKPVDKIIRKRGRPRLSETKAFKEYPRLSDTVPFLQNTSCVDVQAKLSKCRECRIIRSSRTVLHAYCRFMEYRKLYYGKNGTVLNAGFSEPSDATTEHLNQWLPQLKDPPKDLNCNTAKALVEHIGDQFCDLIEQEKEALSLHIGREKVLTWKRIVQGVREMCDVCYTTLFNIHWVCPICGLAVCIDCYKGRKQGITVEDTEGLPKNRDQYNWLLCILRQPHDPEKLIMAQIIPGNALWKMRELLHQARKKWNIPSYCKCNPQEVTTPDKYISTGICKQLMSFVTKSFSSERTNAYYNNESSINNGDSNYDDLDIEVTGSALKWLEGAVNTNSLDSLKHADDYFNNYEDFTSLRGNLLSGIDEEDIISESEREFTSFSLGDIIDCVTKPQNNDKDNSGKAMVKHFSNRYPQANSGRDPLPIRIYTKLESNLAFSSVPHSWFCNGRLLFLQQSDHKDNLALFQEQWKRGQPILVKGVDERLNMDLWHPDAFCRDFGEVRNDLVDCRTGAIIKYLPMKRFWEGFESFSKRLKDDNGEYMLLKLKDWPPGEDFSEMLPKRFHDLMKGLPLPEYTHRDGILNLAGRLPSWFVRPDLGPKMYNAYGSALYPTKGTTNLHLDISDAVNVMVYVGIPSDGNAQLHIEEALKAIDEGGCDSLMRARVRARGAKPGALWHIYNARDTDKIRELLSKVAIERGEKLEAHHDPIHDQSWYLDAELRKRLYRDYGVEGYAIAQCLGDAVFIPAGAPHQVRNLHSCVKVAEDFVSPENIAHCFKLTQEFRHLSDTHTNHEDKLQIKNIIFHVVRDALAHLLSDTDVIKS